MGTTLLELEKLIAKELGYATGAPSTTGTTTTLLDTSGDSPLDTEDDDSQYVNWWLKIEADSAVPPTNVGETRRVKTYAPSTATLTTSRAYSASTKTTHTYGLYPALPPTRLGGIKGIDEYINDVLRNTQHKDLTLLSMLTDADMETSATTSWTGANSTLAKNTTYMTAGLRCLSVTASADGGYAKQAVSVFGSRQYLVAADVTVASGSAKLQAYDETNSAEIDSVTTTWTAPSFVWFTFETPATCKSISIRLVGVANTNVAYWDNITLRPTTGRDMPLPSWFMDEAWFEEPEVWGGGAASTTDHVDSLLDSRYRTIVPWWRVLVDHSGTTPYKLEFATPPINGHLFARTLRPYTELSADSDSTNCNKDLIRAYALGRILSDRGDEKGAARWLAEGRQLYQKFVPKVDRRQAQMTRPF